MFASSVSGIIFLKFFVLGVIFGSIFEICKLSKIISKNNIWIVNTINFVFWAVLGTYFCSGVVSLCNGNVLWYAIVAVIIGLFLEQISIGFLFTKFYHLVYNIFVKVWKKTKSTRLGNKMLR